MSARQDIPSDEVMAHHLAVLRDKGDAVYQIERDAIARYIEAQSGEIARLKKILATSEKLYLLKLDALQAAESKLATITESAEYNITDLIDRCDALTERCEALEKVVDLTRELRKAEYNYHAAISWDDISAILSLGNKTREARAKLDAALAEKSNG